MFTAVSLATLAIGIGANTAIFSLIEGVLIKPLPDPNSDRLISLTHSAPGINFPNLNMAPSLYFTYCDENRVFSDVSMWASRSATITGLAEPEDVAVLWATSR